MNSEPKGTSGVSRAPVLESVKLRDVPQTIWNEVLEVLRSYAAPITVIVRQSDSLQGSCSFVEFQGRHFLFTAAHVWKDLAHFEFIGIAACGAPSSTVKIRTHDIKPIIIGRSENTEWDEWGPDFAFLELADSDARNIKSYKNFWNLGNTREMKSAPLQEIGNAAWALVGAPDERIQLIGNNVVFEVRASICAAKATHMRSSFDYVDLGIDTTIATALRSHVCMSGSGLWRVRIIRNQAGQLTWLPNELSLEGVAYWEILKPIVDGYRIIRSRTKEPVRCRLGGNWCVY